MWGRGELFLQVWIWNISLRHLSFGGPLKSYCGQLETWCGHLGAIWSILRTTALKEVNRFGKIKLKPSLYSPITAITVPGFWWSQISRQSAHDSGNIVSHKHQPPLPPGNISVSHFCRRLSQSQDHSAPGRFITIKNSSDGIGKWTRYLPVCSAVPQPTAPPRTGGTTSLNFLHKYI